jgi:hypothetical protein
MKKYILLLILSCLSLSVSSQIKDSLTEIKSTKFSVNPPKTLNFRPKSNNCIDYYEFNDVRTTAKNINTNTDIYATIGKKNDKDFYKFKTTKPNTNINLVLSELTEDYDLILYNSNGTVLTSSYNTGTTNETITYNTNNNSTYYVLVKSKISTVFDPTNCYKLRINTNSSPY